MLNLSNCLDNSPLIYFPSAFHSEKERQWFEIALRSFRAKWLVPLATSHRWKSSAKSFLLGAGWMQWGSWIDGWEKLGRSGIGLTAGSEVLQEAGFAENLPQ